VAGVIARLPRGCPDCTGVVKNNHLEHDNSCPVGRAEGERSAADRRYFEDHPGAQRFVRPITPSEVIELRLVGQIPPGWTAVGSIEVIQIRPGVRARRFSETWMVPLPDGAG
jgi:hypothetical protein